MANLAGAEAVASKARGDIAIPGSAGCHARRELRQSPATASQGSGPRRPGARVRSEPRQRWAQRGAAAPAVSRGRCLGAEAPRQPGLTARRAAPPRTRARQQRGKRTSARSLRCCALSGESKRKALLEVRPVPGAPCRRCALVRRLAEDCMANEARATWRQAGGGRRGFLPRTDRHARQPARSGAAAAHSRPAARRRPRAAGVAAPRGTSDWSQRFALRPALGSVT